MSVVENVISSELVISPLPAIDTWFKVGGGTSRFCRPGDRSQLLRCIEIDPGLRVLGDGANLLVDDEGVDELVVELKSGEFAEFRVDGERVVAGAGVKLPRLINHTVGEGLSGLEVLAGFPATMGGAVVMNAGGAYGQIADVVEVVHAVDRSGNVHRIPREKIDFGYRHSGLNHLIITGVELKLARADKQSLKARQIEIMEAKKRSQPLSANCAGCCFKNPTLVADVPEIGQAGKRVSAGMLIDRAGLKGLRHQSAFVSDVHGNFLIADTGGKARDVIELMKQVTSCVYDRFGVALNPEVVVWSRA